MDPDAHKAQENIAYAKAQLRLAEERNVPCCVNIVGTFSKAGWDAADKSNYAEETYDRIVSITRDIIENQHGGKITFTSTEGEGTTITFTIPIRR